MSGVAVMDKPAFTRDQMTNASDAARNFKEIRKKAKFAPQVILENGDLDSVILDYDQYERLILHLQELEEEVLSERLEQLEQNPSLAIPWRNNRRSKTNE
ncbi:MAG TPA: type II toxin-antitoxin system Phd/YefM family antitoxin [Bacillota bacterium]